VGDPGSSKLTKTIAYLIVIHLYLYFAIVYLFVVVLWGGSFLVQIDVEGGEYVHCIVSIVLIFLSTAPILWGCSLYSHANRLSSMLMWVRLVSLSSLSSSEGTCVLRGSLSCGTVSWRCVGFVVVWGRGPPLRI